MIEELDFTREELIDRIHEVSLKRVNKATERINAAQMRLPRDMGVLQAECDLSVAELDYLEFRLREGLYSEKPKAPAAKEKKE